MNYLKLILFTILLTGCANSLPTSTPTVTATSTITLTPPGDINIYPKSNDYAKPHDHTNLYTDQYAVSHFVAGASQEYFFRLDGR